jgi:membrane-bound serine protease (ClpP class)
MEAFLLNPNVAYLVLVGAFLLAIMALITPGTAVLEICAFFALLLAGWQVYNLPINFWALIGLLLGVIPFILAVRKSGQLRYLALSILALVVGSAFLFRSEIWWQPAVHPVLALIVSGLSAGFLWLMTVKALEASRTRPTHDLAVLIGQIGESKTEIYREGSVQVDGELWSARSEQPIPEGAQVRVVGREGFILEVASEERHTG